MEWFVEFKINLVSSSKLPLLKKYWKHLPPPLPPLAPPQLPPLGAGGGGWGGGGGGGGGGGAGGGAPLPQPPPLDPPNMRNKIHITYLVFKSDEVLRFNLFQTLVTNTQSWSLYLEMFLQNIFGQQHSRNLKS